MKQIDGDTQLDEHFVYGTPPLGRWLRGWNRFDGERRQFIAACLLLSSLVGAGVGLGAGIGLGLWLGLPAAAPASIGALAGGLLAHRLAAWLLYDSLNRLAVEAQRRYLEAASQRTYPGGAVAARQQTIANARASLGWRPEQVRPVSDWLERVGDFVRYGGLAQRYRLALEEGRIYLVDVGFGEEMVYQRGVQRLYSIDLLRLRLQNEEPLAVGSLASDHLLDVVIKEIPSFSASEDPDERERGASWVTVDYALRVDVRIPYHLVGAVLAWGGAPLEAVAFAIQTVARRALPYVPYKRVISDDFRTDFTALLLSDSQISGTGLHIRNISITGVQGSRRLAAIMENSFKALRTAGDRVARARQFAALDREFRNHTGGAPPDTVREMRARAGRQYYEYMRFGGAPAAGQNPDGDADPAGLAPLSAYLISGQSAAVLNPADQPPPTPEQRSLAFEVNGEAFAEHDRLVREGRATWGVPTPPVTRSHQDRLAWERKLIEAMAPLFIQPASEDYTFVFAFPGDPPHSLRVIWKIPELPPSVYWDETEVSHAYPDLLQRNIYDYQQTTVWEIFLQTRRQRTI